MSAAEGCLAGRTFRFSANPIETRPTADRLVPIFVQWVADGNVVDSNTVAGLVVVMREP